MIDKHMVRRQRETTELLLKEGIVNQDMIEKARAEVQRTGLRIEKALEKLGFITDEDIVRVRANALGIPYVDLAHYLVDSELVKLIPEHVAKKYKVVPLFKIGQNITVGMVDPQDIVAIDQVRRITKMEIVEPVLASERGIQVIIDSYYHMDASLDEIVKSVINEKSIDPEGRDLVDVAEDPPIIKLVNTIVNKAVQERASDIHIEPEEDGVRVRIRVDGILQEMSRLPQKLQSGVISRIKILAKMDIAESRRPQDGRIWLKVDNRDLDIRVSTFPTVHGENVVLRLLDKSAVLLGLKKLGLEERELEIFEKLIRRPNGIILITGPTGSGKTSTLYTALTNVNSVEKNIITIEDPVEYELPIIRQTEVNPKAGINFANGLRSILRQDPDIIMVGEIRDRETADVAIQAALTGHLVFSTLHTNDAPSALTRLLDMGIESFLVSSSVIGVIAQRLVRVICDKCKEKYIPSADVIQHLGLPADSVFYKGKGCGFCKGSGFSGRIAIFEILTIDESIRKMVDAENSADAIKARAVESGMRSLHQDGLQKALKGVTTLEEVLRVTETD